MSYKLRRALALLLAALLLSMTLSGCGMPAALLTSILPRNYGMLSSTPVALSLTIRSCA